MRFSTAVLFSCLILAMCLQTTKAKADAYQNFLRQLGDKVEELSRGGWTSRDIRELRREVGRRPQGRYHHAYRSFVRLILKSVKRVQSGGIMSKEREAIQILLKANPDPDKQALAAADHETFVKSFCSMAESLNSGGYMSAEREVLRMVARVAPNRKHPPRIYERTHANWSAQLKDLERTLRRGGLMSAEREVIGMVEGLRPQRTADKPVIVPTAPPATSEDWDYDYKEYAVVNPSVVKACGRTYRVSWKGRRPRRHYQGSTRLMILKRTSELIELDEKSCRERWVTDHAKRVVPVRGTEAFVVLREGGLALAVGKQGDVYRLKRNVSDCRPARHSHVTLVHKRGRTFDIKFEGLPEAGGLPISINGRERTAVRLYKSLWRNLR